tara:strand:+ start:1945 stop:5097 length:3153 start_codon:yes stop_codon:yes gene_type:complete
MASITQTVPTYEGGISQQVETRILPGQVKNIVNAIPDVVYGLYKRPGSERAGVTKLPNVQSGGSWFHYYRDEDEGSYIGQVATDGAIRMWKASGDNPGAEQTVTYGTGGATAIKSYLTASASGSEDIQSLTLNDTTFLVNRSKTVSTTGTTPARPDTHFAFIELLRTENGRQYSLNVYNTESTTNINVATRIKIESDTLDEGNGSGLCPGIGTQIFSCSTAVEHTIPTSGINTGTDVITKTDHGWSNGQKIRYWNMGGTTAAGLTDGEEYYVIDAATDTFKVSATSGGSAVNITGTGNNDQIFTELAGTVKSITNAAGTRYTGVGTKSNIIFKITSLGQQGKSGSGTGANDYACSYNRQLTLLHGGEGFIVGDKITVTLDQAKTSYDYTIEIEEIETAAIKADIKAVRPTPTPFDADTAITADAILGGIITELDGTGITAKIIGNGVYLTKSSAFQVEVVDQDLMRSMAGDVNDVTKLPNQCLDGYIVQVSNTRMSDEDDYYVKFEGANGKDGTGKWVECAAPGIVKSFDPATMPHVIQRTSIANYGTSTELATFTVKQFEWADREVGDDVTNQAPSFVGTKNTADPPVYAQDVTINKVLFFRNRVAFLTGSHVILSQPNTAAKPNFWSASALAISAIDPIDIECSSNYPSDLFDGIEVTTGLLCFSSNQQFLLSSDDTVLNPDTAKLRSVSAFNYNTVIPPISLGPSIAWIDNSGKYSRFMESANILREGEPTVVDTSKVVPSLLPKDIDLFTNSRENNVVFFGKTGSNDVIGFRYWNTSEGRSQAAWFKWQFKNNAKYHFCIDDAYYYLDSDNFLQKVNLIQATEDPSIDQDSINYLLHLDNHTTISGGVYSATTQKTTFTHGSGGCVFNWQADVSAGTGSKLVLVDSNTAATRIGRYAECTVTSAGATFTVPGDWSSATLHIGYLYDYQVEFPRIYMQKMEGRSAITDINSSLVLHRIKLNFGKVGLYQTTLSRVGKTDYTHTYESTTLDEYDASDAPYLEEKVQTVPIYEKNSNVDITLKSAHPAPATLHSMSWEGDFTPKNYRRV